MCHARMADVDGGLAHSRAQRGDEVWQGPHCTLRYIRRTRWREGGRVLWQQNNGHLAGAEVVPKGRPAKGSDRHFHRHRREAVAGSHHEKRPQRVYGHVDIDLEVAESAGMRQLRRQQNGAGHRRQRKGPILRPQAHASKRKVAYRGGRRVRGNGQSERQPGAVPRHRRFRVQIQREVGPGGADSHVRARHPRAHPGLRPGRVRDPGLRRYLGLFDLPGLCGPGPSGPARGNDAQRDILAHHRRMLLTHHGGDGHWLRQHEHRGGRTAKGGRRRGALGRPYKRQAPPFHRPLLRGQEKKGFQLLRFLQEQRRTGLRRDDEKAPGQVRQGPRGGGSRRDCRGQP